MYRRLHRGWSAGGAWADCCRPAPRCLFFDAPGRGVGGEDGPRGVPPERNDGDWPRPQWHRHHGARRRSDHHGERRAHTAVEKGEHVEGSVGLCRGRAGRHGDRRSAGGWSPRDASSVPQRQPRDGPIPNRVDQRVQVSPADVPHHRQRCHHPAPRSVPRVWLERSLGAVRFQRCLPHRVWRGVFALDTCRELLVSTGWPGRRENLLCPDAVWHCRRRGPAPALTVRRWRTQCHRVLLASGTLVHYHVRTGQADVQRPSLRARRIPRRRRA
mmetsp:Transcript_4480/g.11421  ORF Transcript_4480/g.11421 Transcript_4480/m.11421 type:complete len:271 (+) Transcript_4480:573-1385(+)